MTELQSMWGASAVAGGSPDFDLNDPRTNLVDTLANLMHFAEHREIDFDDALETARGHYEAEVREDV